MPDKGVLGLCQAATYAKWAEILMLHPHDWHNDGPNKDLGYEAVLVHELLHVFMADCRASNLSEEDEELIVTRLTDRLMAIDANRLQPRLTIDDRPGPQ